MKTICIIVALLPLLTSVQAQDSVDALIRELPVPNHEKRDEVFGKLISLGPAAISELCGKLVETGKGDDLAVRFALHGLAVHVQRKGANLEREAYGKAMAAELKGNYSPAIKGFIIRQLHHAGSNEAVSAMANTVVDPDLSEYAVQALLSIGGNSSAKVLREALPKASGKVRMTVIQALGVIRDTASTDEIAKSVSDQGPEMRIVAMNALGSIGQATSAGIIAERTRVKERYEANKATDAYLLLASRLYEAGKSAEVGAMYKDLFEGKVGTSEAHVKCAALLGMAKTQGDKALDLIYAALTSDSRQLRAVAAAAALESKGEHIAQWWLDKIPGAPPVGKAAILDVLTQRGERIALAAALTEMKSENAQLRSSALNAVVVLGDESTVPPLVSLLASNKDEDRKAAQEAMVRISNVAAVAAMATAMIDAKGMSKAGLIDILSRKGAVDHLDAIVVAASDPDISVRSAAWNAIRAMCDGTRLPKLLELHAAIKSDSERATARNALSEIYVRSADKNAATAQIVKEIQDATEPTVVSLLSILQRVGHSQGLSESRKLLKSDKATIVDAAVRAISGWPNQEAISDQLAIAQTAEHLPHQVLSLRGFDRLLRQPGMKTTDALKQYELGFKAAKRREEKGLMISGMGNIASPETLKVLQTYATDKAHAAVAMAAVKKVALEVFRTNPEGAKNGVLAYRNVSEDQALLTQVNTLIAELEKLEGHITEWMVSEKFTQQGKKVKELFGIKFPAETDDPKKPATWEFVSTAGTKHPWYVDLHDYGGGNDAVMYLRTFIRAETATDGRIELGFDDTLKVWLNGEQIFAVEKAHRYVPAEESADIRLNAGWNELLVKVVNGTANWEASVRIRQRDGTKLNGLTYAGGKDYLTALEKDVGNDAMRDSALQVAVKLIPVLKAGKGDEVKKFLHKLMAATNDPIAVKLLSATFDEVDKYGGYIKDWKVSGPYQQAGKDGQGLFDVIFPPEDPKAKDVKWKAQPKPGDWRVDLMNSIGSSNAAGYLRTYVMSPIEQEVILQCGSDDGLKCFMNGKAFHHANELRGGDIGTDRAKVVLAKGWNVLLLKVTNNGGGWNANARFRSLKGGEVEGLKIMSKSPE